MDTVGGVTVVGDDRTARVVLRFFGEVLSGARDLGGVPRLLSSDFVDHDATGEDAGIDGVSAKLSAMWQALPDARFVPHLVVAAGGYVSVLSRLRSVSGEASFADVYRVEDDLIREHWHVVDTAALATLFAAAAN